MKKILVLFILISIITAFSAVEIKISGWPGNPNEETAMMKVVENFNNTHKDIKVVWDPIPGDYKQTLLTRLSAGTAPDIFYIDISYFQEFANKNVLLPLDLYVKKDNYDIDDFYENLIDGFTSNNRLYGIPKDFSTLALYYNEEIFDKYDVEYPTSNDTWQDFLSKAQKLKQNGYETPLVLAADFNRAIPFIIGNDGKLVNDDLSTAITSQKSIEGIEFYVNLINKYGVGFEPSNVGSGWIGEAIANSKVAMGMSGPWTKGFIEEQYPDMKDKIKVVELPVGKKRASMIYTVSWSINRQTKNRQEAWEVLKYLTTEGQKVFTERTSILPSRKSLAQNIKNNSNKVFFDSVEYGIPWTVPTKTGIFSRANDQINSLLKDLFYNKITIEEAQNIINQKYDEWNSSN
ncbi:ABC transporter substrate-binding protein [Oceanotoga teriensis]|uniref:ABC transporter substrate-binding protein n=1 Tax=Oceanotoga teriensis TaxID=515440 RepID=UPI002712852A|nr:ABC transporter substrate-binding protein [Oceanotoga teriensis]MDO7976580.1 ABC transporter substrate-binding protein [Oceanotoga teriensis]